MGRRRYRYPTPEKWSRAWEVRRGGKVMPSGLVSFGSNLQGPASDRAAWGPSSPDVGAISGLIISEDWGDIHTAPTTYDWSFIDDHLTLWDDYNPDVFAMIRIYSGGSHAPSWLYANGVNSFSVVSPEDGGVVTGPKWWEDESTSQFQAHIRTFIKALATRYDGNAQVRAVALFGGMNPTFAEPMLIRPNETSGGQTNAQRHYDAGCRRATQESAYQQMIKNFACFHQTYLELICNPVTRMTDSTSPYTTNDEALTEGLVDYHRALHGRWGVVSNESLGWSTDGNYGNGNLYGDMYVKLRAVGMPLGFQVASAATARKLGHLPRAIRAIASLGGCWAEIPTAYRSKDIQTPESGLTTATGTSATSIIRTSGSFGTDAGDGRWNSVRMTSGGQNGSARSISGDPTTTTTTNDTSPVEAFAGAPVAGDTFSVVVEGFEGADGSAGGVAAAKVLRDALRVNAGM